MGLLLPERVDEFGAKLERNLQRREKRGCFQSINLPFIAVDIRCFRTATADGSTPRFGPLSQLVNSKIRREGMDKPPHPAGLLEVLPWKDCARGNVSARLSLKSLAMESERRMWFG